MSYPYCSIPEAVEEIKSGRILIVIDDEDRENEGDFIMAAERTTPAAINFMARYGRGLICLPTTRERLEELKVPAMVGEEVNTALHSTRFTVSVDAVNGTTSGISAADRAETVQVFVRPESRPDDLARPGHIFPLQAFDGGVLRRAGHTEATVDMVKLAGLYPAGVLCEIMDDDGSMARLPRLVEIANEHDLKIITIKDLIEYRRRSEKLVKRVVTTTIPSRHGEFESHLYEDQLTGDHHVALVKGNVDGEPNVLVRVHSQCLTGDVFGSMRCDCGDQLQQALKRISDEGSGVLLYMRQEGRGIGLANKLRAYALQDQGHDTVEANLALGLPVDARDYGIGSQILADLGLTTIRIMTNNPSKRFGIEGYGLEVTERVPLQTFPNSYNVGYLKTKRGKLGHLLDLEEPPDDVGFDSLL
ncbi:MAG: bifunctional 3,4-dihydroxy-2-butanone-4-phosphate synthase/GTP cyclohydrolase II [Gemmatimonadota bacterium]|nr:bifunctional 3,4-dihydroxy-2-butanone-4-phosphate synthase/GTP cyclohydrolase II [Gemmatimonadota bacterium]MXW06154.1 bifunctional 3,4-dihydroxy-2-butanone-4-phosphate synthase/GTP cyclohydrolase II [Gemmatimonadota bacterium]MYB62397.1 bifunctional 3,4-dihydroxy-2-butanone-4-phosphate synthase/GTP cyclohydrolase II [Gemmatimonadota bacterium]